MPRVITIGSALVDIFITSKNFELKHDDPGVWLCQRYDDKVEVDSFQVTTGGGGSNTAVGFARMGFETAVVAELGIDAWAELVESDFKKEGVETSLLIREKKEETGGSIILSAPEGGRTILVHRGAASMLDPHDLDEMSLKRADWIHLSSISGQLGALQKILRIIAEHQLKLSWNPGKGEIRLLTSGQLKLGGVKIAVLFVNQGEWEQLKAVQAQLHQACAQIVVTQGEKGGIVYQQGQIYQEFSGSQAKNVVNATGAGDSFAVGYVSAILAGESPQTYIEWGKKNAASVIGKIGAKAGLLHREELL